MKKFLLILLSLMLVAVFAVTGCNGVYNPPIVPPDAGGDGGGTTTPPDEPPVDDGKIIFTVTLVCEGQRFHPETEIHAQWSGEDGLFDEKFNALGVASRELDGDYTVTLSDVPEQYTYDPNDLTANNDHRNLIIELLPIIPTRGTGSGLYSCITITRTGTYRTKLNSRDHRVYYMYAPSTPGKYSIQSWVDVNANEINPIMDYHNGTFAWKNPIAKVYNDGGRSSTFTKNFKFELSIARENIDEEEGMGATWTFGLHADCTGSYPVTVDFTIKLEGTYEGGGIIYEEVSPHGPFAQMQPMGEWRYNYKDSKNVLLTEGIKDYWTGAEDKMYDSIKLQWTDTNGNGIYDSAEWTDTNGNGVLDSGDEWMDINGDGICTVDDEWWDTNGDGHYTPGIDYYKDTNKNNIWDTNGDCWRDTNGNGKFDEGDAWFDTDGDGSCAMGDGGDGFYHLYDKDLYAETDGYGPILFAKFNKDCEALYTYGVDANNRPTRVEQGGFTNPLIRFRISYKGKYYDYTNFVSTYTGYGNNEGAVPVNAELQVFLEAYATTEAVFNDGYGIAEQSRENDGFPGLSSSEDNMWLVFCGYYS